MLTFHTSRLTLARGRARKQGRVAKLREWKMICAVFLLCAGTAVAVNPVPFVNQPLVPDAAAPGSPSFTLTVNGTGFVPTSVVHWNGSPRTTHFVSQGRLTATIPATDIAKPGTASIAVVNPGPGGGASAVVFFPIATPISSASFATKDLASGNGDIQVVTADFNGDGITDLAVSARACGQVLIFLGNGDGTFTESAAYPVGPGGPWGAPYSLAAGDFNGDGKLDLVTANESNFVSVLIGNGDGTFQTHVDYDLGQLVLHLAVGDFDGDATSTWRWHRHRKTESSFFWEMAMGHSEWDRRFRSTSPTTAL